MSREIGSILLPSPTPDRVTRERYVDLTARHRCLCGQCHATTGVSIIAGLLVLSVVLEIWHLMWYLMSGNYSETVISIVFQIFMGTAIAGSVIYALWKENAAFLLPYLLLQTMGLAACFVIFFALLYVCILHDYSTIKAFLESHGPRLMDGIGEDIHRMVHGWFVHHRVSPSDMVDQCGLFLLAVFQTTRDERSTDKRDRSASAGPTLRYYRVPHRVVSNTLSLTDL